MCVPSRPTPFALVNCAVVPLDTVIRYMTRKTVRLSVAFRYSLISHFDGSIVCTPKSPDIQVDCQENCAFLSKKK